MAESRNSANLKPFTMRLEYNNGAEGWDFPVLPPEITVRHTGNGTDYNIIGTGYVRSIDKPGLLEIEIESFFPAQNYPFNGKIAQNFKANETNPELAKRPDPNKYVTDLKSWMASGHPFRFIYAGIDPSNLAAKIWLPVTVDSFEYSERAGSPGDIFFTLRLKEYVFFAPIKVKAVTGADGTTKLTKEPKKRLDLRVPPTTYTIQPGDTLIKIAMKMYNTDSSRYTDIMQANNIKPDEFKKLQVGRELKIPRP